MLTRRSSVVGISDTSPSRAHLTVPEPSLRPNTLGSNSDPSDLNAMLIDAVETGNRVACGRVLGEGADPNARKKVTVNVRLPIRRLWGEGGVQIESDTRFGESALCIAIRDGREDIVRVLLQNDEIEPNAPIEWRIVDSAVKWTRELWDAKKGWAADPDRKLRFESALDFALFSGSRPFNPRGGHIFFDNPQPTDVLSDVRSLTPSIGVVTLLLQHGAHVSEKSVDAASSLSDPAFLDLLRRHLQDPLKPTAGRRPVSVYDPPPPGMTKAEESVESALSADHFTELYSKINSLQRAVKDKENRIAELESERRIRNTQVAELEGKVTGLSSVIDQLKKQMSAEEEGRVRTVTLPFDPQPGSSANEIRLVAGDLILVRRQFSDGWAYGHNLVTAMEGFFPLESSPSDDPKEPFIFPTRVASRDVRMPTLSIVPPQSPDGSAPSNGGIVGAVLKRAQSARARVRKASVTTAAAAGVTA
ncbi:hypothetical protein M427DRAFT_63820 [Gonapodya prolifera JEL478]|uniref:SH3 domain-containing protein n=1 Tax=Gonapodya prolifera (strain JEL478) TaxID=1344416 RepID=A0A138ZYN7_GONPJ|nr:hypothetical protein M427DRAFT_63820 [Gonapodya prolifera JEL478]|eukprot:KXS09622.1 hypothetical protein M427DRAFT_63820 [Gonapodya prolifera JEL478]